MVSRRNARVKPPTAEREMRPKIQQISQTDIKKPPLIYFGEGFLLCFYSTYT